MIFMVETDLNVLASFFTDFEFEAAARLSCRAMHCGSCHDASDLPPVLASQYSDLGNLKASESALRADPAGRLSR